jgi:serine/threonine protein kinase
MSQAPLPLRTRCELALGASNGLAYLHELRIVHFDLKPDNLLLDAPLAVVRAAAGATLDECPSSGKAGTLSPVSSSAAYPCDEDEYLLGGPHQLSGHWPAGAAAVGVVRPAASNSSTAQAVGGAGAAARGRIGRRSSGPDRAAAAAAFDELCEVPVVKVADFGLSKHKLNSTYVSSCRDLRGTLPYMAPELVADPERVCEKADVWSLGVVMWEMLTREIPFQVGAWMGG